MSRAFLAALAASVVAFVLTPVFRQIGRRLGWIDTPNERSSHRVPTPRNGGKAIMLAIGAGVLFAGVHRDATILTMLLLSVALSVLGALDDAWNLRWTVKFGVQLAAAVGLMAAPGFRTDAALMVLAIFWLTGVTNAFNFMDGVNGIASLEAVICGVTMGPLLFRVGDPAGGAFSIVLAGAAFSFFLWNALTGSIFMGDVGSLPLGFLLGSLVIRGAHFAIEPWVMALPLAPFLLDTGLTLVRRTLRGERIFEAHRTHHYQRLTDLGWSHLAVTLLWGALAGIGAIVALAWGRLGSLRLGAWFSAVLLHLLVFWVIAWRHRRLMVSTGRPASGGEPAIVATESSSTADRTHLHS